MKTKRRLRLQILALVMLFYTIGMSVSAISMYYSSRNSFLSAKDDMIERDLDYCTDMLNYPEVMSWFFDYSKQHSDKITTTETHSYGMGLFDIDERAKKEGRTVTELINSLSEEEKVKLAASVYAQITMQFDGQSDIFKYGGLMCFDVRSSDSGFVFYEADKGRNDQNSRLGDRCSIDSNRFVPLQSSADTRFNDAPCCKLVILG